jgi:hypothetical protein
MLALHRLTQFRARRRRTVSPRATRTGHASSGAPVRGHFRPLTLFGYWLIAAAVSCGALLGTLIGKGVL